MYFEEKLIKLVRDRKCLYHTKSRSSKNNLKRVAVWQSISDELGRPVGECKQRWRSLRDRFVRERKKLEQACNSASEFERWELYDALEFLIPSVQRRRRPSNYGMETENLLEVNSSCSAISPAIYGSFSCDGNIQSTPSGSNISTKELRVSNESFMTNDDLSFDKKILKTLSTLKRSASELNDSSEVIGIDSEQNSNVEPEMEENYLPFETAQSIPSVSKNSSAMLKDINETFLELIRGLRTAVSMKLLPEKDENDLFLECIGKKMKRLSEAAKLRIQAKMLADVTEELLKE